MKMSEDLLFYQQLLGFYSANKRKIRAHYKDLTKKLLAYNDPSENPSAFLRQPQFDALSMYIFIKEFMNNAQVYEMFDDWRNRRNKFSDARYYGGGVQLEFFDASMEQQTNELFKRMKKYKEDYPNYIYALTMGLGKTILIATCIFYEFLLARKYPSSELFCHNALVFAPDKTVLQSLREIITFDKAKVIPPEYVDVLDMNIKFHFLDETGMTLNTIDDSDFNIIISNTQKIILKKRHKAETPIEALFKSSSLLSTVYGDTEILNETELSENRRFEKLCRLPNLGVYVDEAHHLFGSDLENQIRSGKGNKTSLRDTINSLASETSIVGCYNYTGTPYVDNQLLPEVVYAYSLKESIREGFLKEAEPIGFENVRNEEFLTDVIKRFWKRYGGKTYEGLNPKIAIYVASVEEAVQEVRPAVDRILSELDIDASKILLNVGDSRYTKDDDIRNFNNLDVAGSEGNEKQFIILVGKGKEGWNCRSLFSVALYRSPKSKIFVLQATMRCMRAITQDRMTATIFLSKENYDTLNDELHKNFNVEIKDLKSDAPKRSKYQVRVVEPPRKIRLKRVWHEYSLTKKEYTGPIGFELENKDLSKYESTIYQGARLSQDMASYTRKVNADYLQNNMEYSELSLVCELARYLNISCILVAKILRESTEGIDVILKYVNKYNQIITDCIIPTIFHALFDITATQKTEEKEIILLRRPINSDFYEFSARDDLVVRKDSGFSLEQQEKSFHADTYCFDSQSEKRFFELYINRDDVKKIYFTGMFTSGQGDLSIYYYDPESGRLRRYYPDFFAEMKDNSYRLIEVKGDNMIDDAVVKAKTEAAREMAVASGIEYYMYSGSSIMSGNLM